MFFHSDLLSVLDNVLLEHGGLLCVLPFLFILTWNTFLTLRGTWGNHVLTLRLRPSCRVCGVVAHEILATAQRPIPFSHLLFDLAWAWTGTWPRACQKGQDVIK